MNFDNLLEQLLGADGYNGYNGYYYRPHSHRPRVSRTQRASRRNTDELLKQYLLRQYLGNLVNQAQYEEEDDDDKNEEENVEVNEEVEAPALKADTSVNEQEPERANEVESETSEQTTSAQKEPETEKIDATEPIKVSIPTSTEDKLISPPLNLYEFEKHYIILLGLTGVDKSAIDIDFHTQSNELVIKGQSIDPYLSGDAEADVQISQISELKFGNFQRQVKLPHAVGAEPEIKARFTNGLLEIKVLKCATKPLVHKITLEDVVDEEFEKRK